MYGSYFEGGSEWFYGDSELGLIEGEQRNYFGPLERP